MNGVAVALAASALAAVVGSWLIYLRSIPGGGVARRPIGHLATQILGMVVAVIAIGLSPQLPVAIPAAVSLLLGAVFLGLLSLRKTPIGELKVDVGDPLIAFQCSDSAGAVFETGSLRGQRALLKFFRGSW